MSFIGVLETVGKDFAKGLGFAARYAVPVEKLAGLLFPQYAPALTEAATATTLIQSAVILVEQKYAASGEASKTGPQKLGEVVLLTEQAVTSLLQQAGIKADPGYLQKLISAVVGILNVQGMPAATPASA
jgi:hypothetical protein